MSWLTLSSALIIAAAAGAVLLRHPGVLLYDWIATRKAGTRTRAALVAPKARPQAASAKHAPPAALAG
ncbi:MULTISPECIES: hypothetical protein [Achromobacter]|jgi:hypothetical protein|uniref:Uncharacterized protein n=1 Tax=Achromobacter kerstersii TaxID=1353890 RepID=A0A6S6ZYW0_9BURK|nr:hypothetical protein [Achromobacter kerstersii]CAB3703511.1 hypothetical protein LMG3441_02698 [Achromobacter kerstersii]